MLHTSGIQKAMPHPLGSSRSHPVPQELISCPTCLPGWWTSRMGTRPCRGVGLSLEPGTSNSLLIRFSSCGQLSVKSLEQSLRLSVFWESISSGEEKNRPALRSCCPWRYRGQSAPTGNSDSSVQVRLATSAPSSSPRPPLKRHTQAHTQHAPAWPASRVSGRSESISSELKVDRLKTHSAVEKKKMPRYSLVFVGGGPMCKHNTILFVYPTLLTSCVHMDITDHCI